MSTAGAQQLFLAAVGEQSTVATHQIANETAALRAKRQSATMRADRALDWQPRLDLHTLRELRRQAALFRATHRCG